MGFLKIKKPRCLNQNNEATRLSGTLGSVAFRPYLAIGMALSNIFMGK
jgi:hypothetical protein